jgi:hypothetical protein
VHVLVDMMRVRVSISWSQLYVLFIRGVDWMSEVVLYGIPWKMLSAA